MSFDEILESMSDLFTQLLIWIQNTFTLDRELPWVCLAVPLWGFYFYKKYWQSPVEIPLDVLALRKKYLSLSPPMPRSKEFMVPMCEMYIYPVRGVRAGA